MAKMIRLALALSLVLLIVGLLAGTGIAAAQDGPPELPHAFYGSVRLYSLPDKSDLRPAPAGTVVTAVVDGEIKGRITVTVPGRYGGEGLEDLKLLVQDGICSGCVIEFYIDDQLAEEVRVQYEYPGGEWQDVDPEWQVEFHSGDIWGLDLIAYRAPSPSGGGGGAEIPPTARELHVDMWGRVTSGTMTEGGVLTEIIVATSADGAVTMRLALGTEVLDCEGELVEVIRVDPIEPPPPPVPPDGYIIVAYDIEPCATFDPPVDLVLEYDEEALPEGVEEQNLVIAFYSEDIGEWVVVMPSVVDTFGNTVTARITHTTVFAILGAVPAAEFTLTNLAISPGEVSPGEDVTITVLVTNTGGSTGSITLELRIAGMVEATGGATLAPGASDTVTFTVSRDETGTYGVTVDGLTGSFRVTEAEFPWWAVWLGVGLGAFLLILTGYFWWRRARA